MDAENERDMQEMQKFALKLCSQEKISHTNSTDGAEKFHLCCLIFGNLGIAESEEVTNVTGCLKPCHFKKYIFLGDPSPSSFKSEHYVFSLWAVSSKTKVEKEELIYPMSSLVAEFGGTLGLFLGFSFISVWDNFDLLKKFVAYLGQRNK